MQRRFAHQFSLVGVFCVALILSLLSSGIAQEPTKGDASRSTSMPSGQASPIPSTATPLPSPSVNPLPITTVPAPVVPAPSPSTTPNFWQATAGNWVALGGAVLAALIAGAFGVWQFHKNRELQKELQRRGQQFDREKMELQSQLDLAKEEAKRKLTRKLEQDEEEEKTKRAGERAPTYREKLIAALQVLKILDLSRPLNLEHLYVTLRVKEEEAPRYVTEEEIAPLSQGEPTELLLLAPWRLAEHVTEVINAEEALTKFRRIVLLGDPGAGKTTTLRFLALKMAQKTWNHLPDLPVYVELQGFITSGQRNFLDYIASNCTENYGFSDSRSYWEQQLEHGAAALLLDGLDEVLGGESASDAQAAYDLATNEINRLATRFPKAPIAVTCRRKGWRGKLHAFQNLEVLDFDWPQMQEFIKNWFSSSLVKANGLQQALQKNVRMQMLAANPLLLSLIATVYDRHLELPEQRAELYKRCVEVLLKEWDACRGIKRYRQFTTDRKQDLLKEIAWHFHRSRRRYFPKTELLEVIATSLPSISIPPEKNAEILEEIAEQYGLLKVQAEGWYGFMHLTLQEYFAALATKERGQVALDEIIRHRHDPWWEEVLLLRAGMGDISPLLLGILGRPPAAAELRPIDEVVPPGEDLVVNDDLFHSDLVLAARCLVGAPEVRLPGLRARIIAEVKGLLLTSPHELDWERAARVLIEIESKTLTDELLDLAINNANSGMVGRARIVLLALGKCGDEDLARRLLTLLEGSAGRAKEWSYLIVEALAALKADFAAPVVLERLKAEKNDRYRGRIAKALGDIGNQRVAPELVDMLRPLRRERYWFSQGAIEALGKLGNGAVAESLLQIVLDKHVDPCYKPDIAKALKRIASPSLLNPILQALRDDCIEWQIRWLLTIPLEPLQDVASAPLLALFRSTDTDRRVKTGIAATLGAWRDREVIPYICQAINERIVPPDWTLGSYIHFGFIWLRITTVLKSLGDDSVVPALVSAYQEGLAQGLSNVLGIIYAASAYKPESLTRQLISLIGEPVQRGDRFLGRTPTPLSLLSYLTTKPLARDIVSMLREEIDKRDHARGQRFEYSEVDRILAAIAEVADDVQAVEDLLYLMNSELLAQYAFPTDSTYRAVYQVSQRAKVRVTSNKCIQYN